MELKKITIKKFKSIKQPIEISLEGKDKFYTLIGKNGSGKTNVLKALKKALTKQLTYYGREEEIDAEYLFELTDEEVRTYFPAVDIIDETLKQVKIYCSGGQLHVKEVQAPAVEVSFNEYKKKLQDILSGLKKTTGKYWKQLLEFEKDEFKDYVNNVEVLDEQNMPTQLTEGRLRQIRNEMTRQIKEIEDFFNTIYKDGKFKVDRDSTIPYIYTRSFYEISFYKIAEYNAIQLSPLVIHALGLTSEKVEEANKKIAKTIKRINNRLEGAYNEIKECLKRFEVIKNEIGEIYSDNENWYYQQDRELNKLRDNFIKLVRGSCYRTGYYLDNENSLLFQTTERYQDSRDKSEYFNSNNPIIEAFHVFLKEGGYYQGEEKISDMSKIPGERLNVLVEVLNTQFLQSLVPAFDKSEILGFELSAEKGVMQLFVRERNGDRISFNQTSLGRRWYLTYLFVKSLLKEGDYFFIDEPAAFLHPQAQEEIRADLINLSQKGIYVFIATHSAYMTPDNWKQIYNVTIGESGTSIQSFGSGDELCETIKEELGINTTRGVLFNLSKTLLLVEGSADKACVEKFAELLEYDLRNYHIHVCDGHSILQLCYLCSKYRFPYKAILDEDNKHKEEGFIKAHSMHKECMQVILSETEACFFVGEGKNGAIEDLFVETPEEKFKYYNKHKLTWKVDRQKIVQMQKKDCSEKTLQNFEQLFIKLGIPKLDKDEEI